MNSTLVVTLLLAAVLFFSLGYFLASVALSSSIRSDLLDLEAERLALDEEREMLTRYWALDQAPVKWDLGGHKRIQVTQ